MKLFIFLSLVSFNLFASELNFKCEFTDVTYVNQFSLTAKNVDTSASTFEDMDLEFTLRSAGRESKIETYSVVRSGTVQVFPAGQFYRHETVRLASVEKGAELEYVNLLIDVPPLHSSQIRFLDGLTYFGSCKSF